MMNYTSETFKKYLEGVLTKPASETSPQELHNAVGDMIMNLMSEDWEDSRNAHRHTRHASYLSMEFLMGRAVYNNLLCLRNL